MAVQKNDDLQKMQRDAERRMRDMQKRADRAISSMPPVPNFVDLNSGRHSDNVPPQNPCKEQPRPDTKVPDRKPGGKGFDLLRMLNFKNFKLDSDVLLIIVMIFLLSSDDSDELLLLALLYIML